MRTRFARLISLIFLALCACSRSAPSALPTMTPGLPPAPRVGLTDAPLTQVTASLPTASPTPFASFEVQPEVAGLKLRVGPGYLFDALRLLEAEAVLKVQGKAPGGEWIKVVTADETAGWVFAKMVKTSVDLQAIPVVEPQGILMVRGSVQDAQGTPISGVGFEAVPEGGTPADGNVAFSDSAGAFYLFLPITASGTWTVTQTALDCQSNIWADMTCSNYKAGYSGTVEPVSRLVLLPQSGELSFLFK